MQLVKAHDYLRNEFTLPSFDALRLQIRRRPEASARVLRCKALVAADAVKGLKLIPAHHLIGFTYNDACVTTAFHRETGRVTVADYYHQRGEKLKAALLQVAIIGKPNENHREFFPLEKLYVHLCARPCQCPEFPLTREQPPRPHWHLPGQPTDEIRSTSSGLIKEDNNGKARHDMVNTAFRPIAAVQPTRRNLFPSPPDSGDETPVTVIHKPRAVSARVKEAINEHSKQQRMLERIAKIIVDSGAIKLPSTTTSKAPVGNSKKDYPKIRSSNADFGKIRNERSRHRKGTSTDPEIDAILQRFIDESDQERENDTSGDEPRAGCSHY